MKEKNRKHSRSRERENFKKRINCYEEFESEELRKKLRALLKSFYGYTDDNNPFGDPELSKPYIWQKKIFQMRQNGLEPFLDSQTLILKLKNAKKDIEYLRKCRTEREELRDAIEDEKLKQYKDRNEAANEEWKQKDEKFRLAQEKLRTEIRIKQGREKPVDFIHKVLNFWKGYFPIPMDFWEIPEYQKPYELFDLLTEENLRELCGEMRTHLEVDVQRLANRNFVCFYIDIASNFKQQHNISEEHLQDFIEFWKAMIVICESYITPEKNIKNIDPKVLEDIKEVLRDKTFQELDELETLLQKNLDEQFKHEEIQLWNNTLSVLRIQRCKMIIDKFYQEFYNTYKEKLEKIKLDNASTLQFDKSSFIQDNPPDEANLSPPMYESDEEYRKQALTEHDYLFKISENRKQILAVQISKWQKACDDHNRQVALQIKGESIEAKAMAQDIEEINSDNETEMFLKKINKKCITIAGASNTTEAALQKIQNEGSSGAPGTIEKNTLKETRFFLKEDNAIDLNLVNEMMQVECQELGDGEAIFNDVVPISNNYLWANKYKPRKPRYFNRVKTGYEWNKYNQVHYDYDNPPPKVIQGYKFNIFYPDLIDKTKAPQYTLERSDAPDTCIIRFHAGPPYEDIAFKIVNREWDMTERANFKNLFDRGILYLYFNFKRYRYKR